MLKSMTGFGRSENNNGGYTCKVEVRSVNNRFLDITVRLPKSLAAMESAVKNLVKSRCARGSVDLTLSIEKTNGAGADQELKVNMALAAQYAAAIRQIKTELGLGGDVEIGAILGLRDAIKFEAVDLPGDKSEVILQTVGAALEQLVKMREEEGANLQKDILDRIAALAKLGAAIKTRQPDILREYKDRLREKIRLLSEGLEVDETRLAQETAFMADRCDVTEEEVRLESHLQQFRILVLSGEPLAGRKLEFIVQEINRETNTIGSKTTDYQVTEWVIEMKSALEKIREQLQNIE